jgi:hypothetical protein
VLFLLSGGKTIYFGLAAEACNVSWIRTSWRGSLDCELGTCFHRRKANIKKISCFGGVFGGSVLRISWFPLPNTSEPIWPFLAMHQLRLRSCQRCPKGLLPHSGEWIKNQC